LTGISSKKTKFYYVISQLDHWFTKEVEDTITFTPEQDPYTTPKTVKTEMVMHLPSSREQCIHQFLTLEKVKRKLSQFLRQLRSLVPDVPDDFLHSIWSSWLLPNIRAILSSQPESNLDATAYYADRIIEATP
jgi:hypothetical protein